MRFKSITILLLRAIAQAQEILPSTTSEACDSSPCHPRYQEFGVVNVTQFIESGPDAAGCCSYGAFPVADNKVCCYSGLSLRAGSRFSCPVTGLAKPSVAECNPVVAEADYCEAAIDVFKDCTDNKRAADFFANFCPSVSGAPEIISNVLNILKGGRLTGEQIIAIGKLTIGIQLGYLTALLTSTNPVTAPVAVAIGGLYLYLCGNINAQQAIVSICESAVDLLDKQGLCDGIGSKRSILAGDAIRIERAENPCSQLLRLFPTEEQCNTATVTDCSQIRQSYLNATLTAEQADTALQSCPTAAKFTQGFLDICDLRKRLAEQEAVCGGAPVLPPPVLPSLPTGNNHADECK